jgi:hypothetical protein
MPQASLVAWYGLSSHGSPMTGGLPNSTHAQLDPHMRLALHSTRQVVAEAQKLIGPKARLVLHGVEYEAERYGLAAGGSVTYLTTWETPLAPEILTVEKSWSGEVLAAARTLKWPASAMQWWVAPLLEADRE